MSSPKISGNDLAMQRAPYPDTFSNPQVAKFLFGKYNTFKRQSKRFGGVFRLLKAGKIPDCKHDV